MATVMEWGKDDCLTDLFGDDAHNKISWLKEGHDETVAWIYSLSGKDRLNLFRNTFLGQGYIKVDSAIPGDAAIGNFSLAVNFDFDFPMPWFAQMGIDHLWYVRMPRNIRVVEYTGAIEIFRCLS